MQTTKWLALLVLIAACGGDSNTSNDGGNSGINDDAHIDATSIDAMPPDAALPDAKPPIDCTALKPLPITATVLEGFTDAEDFAFDAEGNVVSEKTGNVVKQPRVGARTLFSPNIGAFETAGTRYLSNGDLMLADVDNGGLLRFDTTGTPTTVLSGFAYPNGLEVGMDDFVYVAEHNAGNIRRVNPDTGEFTIIASGLNAPNGLSFSPDYRTLYFNSFGGGTVHGITVDDQGAWSEPVLLGTTDGGGGGGGLDGLAVDACGNVYVTEYIAGFVWRFTPEGVREKVTELPSQWIPNLHWGSGIGGWDENILYVADRDEGRLFELDLGIVEKDRVYP